MKGDWTAYRYNEPCYVCGHRRSGCKYKGAVADPISVMCFRESKGAARAVRDGMGWIHDIKKVPFVRNRPRPKPAAPAVLQGIDAMARAFEDQATPADVAMWAAMLGVSVDSLRRLNVGWCEKRTDAGKIVPVMACSFPMRDAWGRIIGVRFRNPAGKKWAMTGSLNGLFIPRDLSGKGPLLIVEGPTETAAALDLGFDVIGRPGNTAGRELLVAYCKRHRRQVVILRNNDPKGSRAEQLTIMGANYLAGDLKAIRIPVRIIAPPITKDLRDWKKAGATRAVIEARIRNATAVTNIAP